MPRNNRIRILRSETVGQNATDLTAGEPFINIAERRLVIGGTGNTTPIGFRSERDSVWSVNGNTGAIGLPLAKVSGAQGVQAVTGVAMFNCNDFIVGSDGKVSIGSAGNCFLCPPGMACDYPAGSSQYWGGVGATFDETGKLLSFVFDIAGLTEGGEASRTQYIPIFQPGGTKKVTAEKFISDNAGVFTSKNNSGQLSITKDTGTNSVDFAIVMGAVAANDQGLVKGASAFQYITQNTVKSINGLTGDVGCIAVTCAAQSFSGLQTFLHGISGASADLGRARISGLNYPTGDGADGDFITTDGNGNLSWINVKDAIGASATYFILRDEKGNTSQIDDGNIMTVTGGPGINVLKYANDSIAVQGVTATDIEMGVASFTSGDFTISGGMVSLSNSARTNRAQTFTGLQSFANGISASGITAYSSNLIDPTVSLNSVGSASGYFTIKANASNPINNRFASTSFAQYSWLTNIYYNGSNWVKDFNTYSGWRMNQLVATTDNGSQLQWSYATPASTDLNPLMILYGDGDLRVFNGRLVAQGATFTGNISAQNIVNSVNGVTGAVGLPLATTGNTGVASFNPAHFAVSATGHVSLATPSSSSGTKTYSVFTALDNHPPSTNYASFDTRNGVGVLDFDGLTNEGSVFVGIMPEAASYGSVQARLRWMGASATTGDVVWGIRWENMNTDLDVSSFGGIVEATTTTSLTSGTPATTILSCTDVDGVTAGDLYRIYLYRGATATTDTMVGDAQLIAVEIRGVS